METAAHEVDDKIPSGPTGRGVKNEYNVVSKRHVETSLNSIVATVQNAITPII